MPLGLLSKNVLHKGGKGGKGDVGKWKWWIYREYEASKNLVLEEGDTFDYINCHENI